MMIPRLALLAFLLCACAPLQAPPGTGPATPAITDTGFVTADGVTLPLRHWDSAVTPRAVIVALHGMNDYSNAFDSAAKIWAGQGIATYAYDQRGFGAAPHPGLWAGRDAMRDDLCDMLAAVRRRHPGVPVFALGESMGGAVILTALASARKPDADGIVLVSPAVWSRADMPLSYRVALFLGAHLFPSMTVTGRGLHIVVSDNVPMLRALSRDPLVLKQTRIDAIWGLTDLMDAARLSPAAMDRTPPLLVLRGDKDAIIPAPPSDALIAELGARAAVKRYADGYHMLTRDLDGDRVARDIGDWVLAKAATK